MNSMCSSNVKLKLCHVPSFVFAESPNPRPSIGKKASLVNVEMPFAPATKGSVCSNVMFTPGVSRYH